MPFIERKLGEMSMTPMELKRFEEIIRENEALKRENEELKALIEKLKANK